MKSLSFVKLTVGWRFFFQLTNPFATSCSSRFKEEEDGKGEGGEEERERYDTGK